MAICAGALALGLAACGGGGGGGSMSTDTTETDRSADEQRMKITGAIAAAQSAVGALDDIATDALIAAAEAALAAAKETVMAADALSAGEKGAYDTTISVIEGNFAQARSSIAMTRDELRRATATEAARLRTALDGARISDIAATVEYGAAPTLAGTIPSDPPVPVTGLRPEAVAGSATRAGGWTGAYSVADEAAGTADTIVFYTDIDPPGTQPFGGEMGKYGTANGLDTDGNLPIVAATDATLIASTDFPTGPGIRTHMAGMNGVVEVAGTFDGALGNYVCVPGANGCTSSIRAGGGIALQGGGGWKFVPAQGAVVAKPDTEYAWFGWWQRTVGESYAVGAFHGGGDAAAFADFPRLQGTATYRGPAVGKFVFDPQIGVATAGDFTATATLAVDFGDDADPGERHRDRRRVPCQRRGGTVVGRAAIRRDRRRRGYRGRGHRLVDRRTATGGGGLAHLVRPAARRRRRPGATHRHRQRRRLLR